MLRFVEYFMAINIGAATDYSFRVCSKHFRYCWPVLMRTEVRRIEVMSCEESNRKENSLKKNFRQALPCDKSRLHLGSGTDR